MRKNGLRIQSSFFEPFLALHRGLDYTKIGSVRQYSIWAVSGGQFGGTNVELGKIDL